MQGYTAANWKIRLYNRWSRKVYRLNHYNNTWDAQGQPAGLYYYLLTHIRTGQRLKGWVEIAR
ncbi:MAG: gliding motility-associated C-terminal domain-containing protein [Janthinobacterium lividum]